jgi:hypothetical protein
MRKKSSGSTRTIAPEALIACATAAAAAAAEAPALAPALIVNLRTILLSLTKFKNHAR